MQCLGGYFVSGSGPIVILCVLLVYQMDRSPVVSYLWVFCCEFLKACQKSVSGFLGVLVAKLKYGLFLGEDEFLVGLFLSK